METSPIWNVLSRTHVLFKWGGVVYIKLGCKQKEQQLLVFSDFLFMPLKSVCCGCKVRRPVIFEETNLYH